MSRRVVALFELIFLQGFSLRCDYGSIGHAGLRRWVQNFSTGCVSIRSGFQSLQVLQGCKVAALAWYNDTLHGGGFGTSLPASLLFGQSETAFVLFEGSGGPSDLGSPRQRWLDRAQSGLACWAPRASRLSAVSLSCPGSR